jgi:hypothetical protein
MGSGIDQYWRQKRAYEQEQRIMKHLLDFVASLLHNKPTFRMAMEQMDKDGFGLD